MRVGKEIIAVDVRRVREGVWKMAKYARYLAHCYQRLVSGCYAGREYSQVCISTYDWKIQVSWLKMIGHSVLE